MQRFWLTSSNELYRLSKDNFIFRSSRNLTVKKNLKDIMKNWRFMEPKATGWGRSSCCCCGRLRVKFVTKWESARWNNNASAIKEILVCIRKSIWWGWRRQGYRLGGSPWWREKWSSDSVGTEAQITGDCSYLSRPSPPEFFSVEQGDRTPPHTWRFFQRDPSPRTLAWRFPKINNIMSPYNALTSTVHRPRVHQIAEDRAPAMGTR